MSKADLRLDWCSHEAAKYAVEKWHYSQHLPAMSKVLKIGVWESGKFIGAVLYSWGANFNIGKPYSLRQTEVCELVRVALAKHTSPVSKIVAISIKMLHTHSPGVRLIVSYADPARGHIGGIYQAMNWLYVGQVDKIGVVQLNGQLLHKKTVRSRYGHNNAAALGGEWVYTEGKYKYLYPMDDAMRAQIAPLAKPYPKKVQTEDVRP